MRLGVTVSFLGHVALLALGLVSLGARPLEPETVDSIAVDLIPIEAFSNIRAGSLESQVLETETPSIVDTETPAELGQRTGNTQEDQVRPQETETATPVPVTNTAPEEVPEPTPEPTPQPTPEPPPPPPPAPEPTPAPVPLAAPPAPAPAPAPEPTPEPEAAPEPVPEPVLAAEPTPAAEPQEVAPRPVTRVAALDEARAQFQRRQQQQAAAAQQEREAAERAERERREREERERAQAEARRQQQQQQQTAAREADDISQIINNEQSRGAVTGQGGQQTLGRQDGTAARLTRSELDGLTSQMKSCWNLLPSEIDSGLSVRLLVSLNSDGSVSGTPQITEQDGSAIGRSIARAAQRAVVSCGPYRLAAEKYDEWRQIDVLFNASDL